MLRWPALCVVALACAPAAPNPVAQTPAPSAPARAAAPEPERDASLALVESCPIETTLDHADVPDAASVWPEMIERAQRTLDFAEFYASDAPGSRLSPVIEKVERAAARGVRVRFLADAALAKQYPDTLDRVADAGV